MGVKKFGFEELKKKKPKKTNASKQILRRLSYIGEKLCEHARNITPGRSSGGYDDQTGNLRSSIGYRIYKDGKPMRDGGFKKKMSVTAKESLAQKKHWTSTNTVPIFPKMGGRWL